VNHTRAELLDVDVVHLVELLDVDVVHLVEVVPRSRSPPGPTADVSCRAGPTAPNSLLKPVHKSSRTES